MESADLNVRHAISFDLPAQGTEGGQPGRKGRVIVNASTSNETVVEGWSYELKAGDTLTFEGGGGGGLGEPLQRSPDNIVSDVTEGFVSIEGARNDYGVVIRSEDGIYSLDKKATGELRSKLGTPLG